MLSSTNEWSPLKTVLVGRAENSIFPNEPLSMLSATMPSHQLRCFQPNKRFPEEILASATRELDHFATLLEREGIKVYRPDLVHWDRLSDGPGGGYTAAMPRDGLLVVGNTIIEACFAWRSRRDEVVLGYGRLLDALESDPRNVVIRAPKGRYCSTGIYSADYAPSEGSSAASTSGQRWAINESRPAFDAADFMRFGTVILGQLSHVTNRKGVDYLRSVIPHGFTVELIEVDDPHAMHLDATLLPLRRGLLVFNPERVRIESLQKHKVLQDWTILPCPIKPKTRPRDYPPLYMTSGWLFMNLLNIDEHRAFVEESDVEMAAWIKSLGIQPILCPFKNVNSIGGSFHCATVDLRRE